MGAVVAVVVAAARRAQVAYQTPSLMRGDQATCPGQNTRVLTTRSGPVRHVDHTSTLGLNSMLRMRTDMSNEHRAGCIMSMELDRCHNTSLVCRCC